ncbi:hypothetical protein WOLCODRAFT_147769 [Wolfiporia cocos MD-104 SS10]|uniref:Cupin 2 conserved barrel domain-containing protein n=1 Tax=Wolfiporia cocos (strain MD-104) TaxID=742152 RepID=A0A2H3IUN0_WOLCO|nr:hypothetical protein WOLCODRAFT_147769 [Wolfiporia cocos MD-104 SS10]
MTADTPLPALRRVVTGHDENGIAAVRSDDRIDAKVLPAFPTARAASIWLTDATPTNDNNSGVDGATRQPDGDLGAVMHNGTVFRYTDLGPGATAAMHRTSSLDYNILIHGRLVLQMEDGSETTFDTPGDVVVQRGTIHAWRNPGPEWTRWVSVLIDAHPAVVGGRTMGTEFRS